MRIRKLGIGAALAGILSSGTALAAGGVTDTEILLGSTDATSGPVAATCMASIQGRNAYIDMVNKAGGINGRQIRYIVLDDGYQPQRAVGNVRRLTQQDDVLAVFGGCGSATAAAALSVIEKTEVPYLFPYASFPEMVKPMKKNVFALLPLYTQQAKAVIPYIVKNLKPKTAAIFTHNIAGGEDLRKADRAALEAGGVEIVADSMFELAQPDRSSIAIEAVAKKPDLVIINDSSPGAARFLLELQRQGWLPSYVTGTSTLSDEGFLRAAGDVANNIVFAPGVVLPPTAPESQKCIDALKAYDSSIQPVHFHMFGCLATSVMVDALTKAGKELTRERLVSTLEGMSGFKTGVSGDVSFSADRRMGLDQLYIVNVVNGQFKVLDQVDAPAGE